ncbi:SufE family protein [Shewanella submarina]|uniref:SufE family protein n=1 Tax=Shewanella submarina TaxID=2016376 RepID=A0ABV7G857_9GAMM|nr:SufE family protein [Shewanella submarina]MCL1037105.1 SufE family protein [Shewanella submarina]
MSASPASQDFLFDLVPLQSARDKVLDANNWQEKYRQIMLLGKQLPTLASELQCESAQVKGCESKAWLYHCKIDGNHYYLVDSEARVVKGLAALVIAQLQGKDSAEIAEFDPAHYFKQLGLAGQLSPSRTNGLTALVNGMIAAAN